MSRIQDFNRIRSIVQKDGLNIITSDENMYYNDYEISFDCLNHHRNKGCKVLSVLTDIKMNQILCNYCRPSYIDVVIESYLNGSKKSEYVNQKYYSSYVHKSNGKYQSRHPRIMLNEFSFYIPDRDLYIFWRQENVSPFKRFMKSFDNIEVWVFKDDVLIDIEYSSIKK
jgi:hypothetical protein